ncbi:hypothetical protein [Gemmatimonas sp.]|uniref:hypothetical protein n=1 Tax=Gemmatimonas sp. TaxID=1962908 RepID=UPI0025B96AB0|nr:hypothetical protein [Gemmatimonas sp.]MCA2992502.1 hypothetical protein [Gemmatimonas sp.]
MSSTSNHQVTSVTPLEALFFVALLSISGSSARVRRAAADVFQRAAMPAVWGFLYRHTGARPSWLRLASITHEATTRFLSKWPTSPSITVESMMTVLESCTCSVDRRHDAVPPATPLAGPLGVLTLLAHTERLQLLHAVRAALTPTELGALQWVAEAGSLHAAAPFSPEDAAEYAVERLESILLSAATYTLGIPDDKRGGRIAA